MGREAMYYGKDILEAVLEDAGELPDSSGGDYVPGCKRYIREAYWDVLSRYPWPWSLAARPGVLTTRAAVPITVTNITKDVSLTQSTVTISEALADSIVDFKFYMQGNNAVYRVYSHTAGQNTFILDGRYVQAESSGAGKLYQDEYPVADDVLKVWGPFQVRGNWSQQVNIIDKPKFEAKYGRAWSPGPAPFEECTETRYTMALYVSNDKVPQFRFAPWSEEAVSMEYEYSQFHDLAFSGAVNTDVPRIPLVFRSVLIDMALYKALDAKDDTRAVDRKVLAEDTIMKMVERYLTPHAAQLYVRPSNSLSLGCT